MVSSITTKKKGRSEKGSFTTTLTACLRAPRSEKNRGKKQQQQQTDHRGEDK